MERILILFILVFTTYSCQMEENRWEPIITEDGLKMRLFTPKGKENQTLPLFVFLHGSGERGDNNLSQLYNVANFLSSDSVQSQFPCLLLFPQCPRKDYWAPIDIIDGQWLTKTTDEPTQVMKKLISHLEVFIEDSIVDNAKVYIGGLSMGGFGTWDLLSRKPDLFAAGVPICGGGDTTKVRYYKDVPIWAFHGADDQIVPVELTRNTVESLKKYGAPIKYTEFPGIDHHSWDLAIEYPGLLDWLFSQTKFEKSSIETTSL